MATFARNRRPAAPLPSAELAGAVADARAEIARTDTKAGMLMTLATGALAGLLAFARARVISLPAVMALRVAAALTTAALAVLLTVIRPRLPRDGIFPDIAALLAGQASADPAAWQAARLRMFTAQAVRKHRRVRAAVDLLAAALAVLTAAAALAAAGGA